jgi:hypothetical protein
MKGGSNKMGWFTGTEQTKSKYVKEQDTEEEDTEEEDTEEEDTEDEEETYEVEIICDNCGNEENYSIPLGITVDEKIRGKKCSNCDCLLKEK